MPHNRTFTEGDFAPQGETEAQPQAQVFSPDAFLPPTADGFSSDTPINESPFGVSVRLKLSTGNKAGNMRFLLQQPGVDAVSTDVEGDLVINKDGAWYRTDEKGEEVGAFELTKRLLKKGIQLSPAGLLFRAGKKALELGQEGRELNEDDVAEFLVAGNDEFSKDLAETIPLALQIGGTVAGARVGGTSGAVIASGIVDYSRSSLGRYFGTYDASKAEQLADAGWEMALTAGGYAIMPALKAAGKTAPLEWAKQGIKRVATGPEAKEIGKAISRVADKATPQPVKDTVSSILQLLSNHSTRAAEHIVKDKRSAIAVERLVRRSLQVGKGQTQRGVAASSTSAAGDRLLKMGSNRSGKAVKEAVDTTRKNYGILETEAKDAVEQSRKFDWDPSAGARDMLHSWSNAGLVTLKRNKKGLSEFVINLNAASQVDDVAFQLFSIPSAQSSFKKLLKVMNGVAKRGIKDPSKARIGGPVPEFSLRATPRIRIDEAFEMRKALRAAYRELGLGHNDRVAAQVLGPGFQTLEQGFVSGLQKSGTLAKSKVDIMNRYYAKNINNLLFAEKQVASPTGRTAFIKQLFNTDPNSSAQARLIWQTMREVDNVPGRAKPVQTALRDTMDRAEDALTAREFIFRSPFALGGGRSILQNLGPAAIPAAAGLAINPAIGITLGGLTLAASSPRLQARVLRNFARFGSFNMQGLNALEAKAQKLLPFALRAKSSFLASGPDRNKILPQALIAILQAADAEEDNIQQLLQQGLGQ